MTFLDNVSAAITAIMPAETAIYQNAEPPSPALCLTIYGTGGGPDTLTLDGATNGERSVQFRLRDPSAQNVQVRAEGLYEAFKVWKTYSPAFVRMKAVTKPLYSYARDANNRSIASFNVTVIAGS